MKNLFDSGSTTPRFFLIGVTVLLLLIPLAMVRGVTSERQSFFDVTLNDIGNAWGRPQDVVGPFLIVPEVLHFREVEANGREVWRQVQRQRVFLPDTLALEAEVEHQYRRRSIYEVPVYAAMLRFSGSFPAAEVEEEPAEGAFRRRELVPGGARIVVGISHTQAIRSAGDLQVGSGVDPFEAGTGTEFIGTGIQAPIDGYDGAAIPFEFELTLKGTQRLAFTPVGGTTRVAMTSSWPHPSFGGSYLPESYEVDAAGFTAEWTVDALARDLPGEWLADVTQVPLDNSLASIDLFQPVTAYTTIDRAMKYGLLFISLTFLGFLCFELRSVLRFHPVQYGVVGLGLVLFYLALLALSEHLPFAGSYLLATMLLTSLIGWYVWAMTGEKRLTGWMIGILAGLYGTLYVLLRLEAFSLLLGTGVLFVGLGALMAVTRNLTGERPVTEPDASPTTSPG
jgi:inner membrane protein